MISMAHLSTRTPTPGVMKSLQHTKFDWIMPQSREEEFHRNNAFSLYDLYDHALAEEALPRCHEIYNFVLEDYILSLSDPPPE